MSNKSLRMHRTSGVSVTLSASLPASGGEKRHNPVPHSQSIQDTAHSRASLFSRQCHPQSCWHHTAAPQGRAEGHSSHRQEDLQALEHNPLRAFTSTERTPLHSENSPEGRGHQAPVLPSPDRTHHYKVCFKEPQASLARPTSSCSFDGATLC